MSKWLLLCHLKLALAALVLVAIPPLDGSVAHAQPPAKIVNADVMVLQATQSDGGGWIDPRIGRMPQLREPPLSAYNTYRLIDRRLLPLEKGKPSAYPLVNGRTLEVTFSEETTDKRYRITAAINEQGGKVYLKLLEVTAAPNEPFFVGGQSYDGGSLVLGITIHP